MGVSSKKKREKEEEEEILERRRFKGISSEPFFTAWCSTLQQSLRKSKARESAPPTILNRARKRITHPPPWSHLLYIFCLLGGAHSALCAHRVDAGERVGAQGMETPRYSSCVLIGLSSPRGSVAQRFSGFAHHFFWATTATRVNFRFWT